MAFILFLRLMSL